MEILTVLILIFSQFEFQFLSFFMSNLVARVFLGTSTYILIVLLRPPESLMDEFNRRSVVSKDFELLETNCF